MTLAKPEEGEQIAGGSVAQKQPAQTHIFMGNQEEGYIHIKLKLNGKTTWQQFSFQRRRNQQQAEGKAKENRSEKWVEKL